MKLAFIGGNGHHYLRGALKDASLGVERPVAVAGDGYANDAAQRLCKGLEGEWYEDPRMMLDRVKPDVVSIGAVYGRNGELVAEALQRDIAVASDKPIAGTWEQLDQLRKLVAEKPSRKIITEFPFRCEPWFRAAREAVEQGLIGDVVLVTAQKSYRFGDSRPRWYADRSLYGGTILWVASHAIDAIHFITGKRYARFFGLQGNVGKPAYGSMEDHTVTVFELENGAHGVVHADYSRPAKAATHGDDRIRLAGSKGVVEVMAGRCKLVTQDQEEQDLTDRVQPRPMHQEMLAALLGPGSDILGTDHSLDMAAVLLTARDAADQRKIIAVR